MATATITTVNSSVGYSLANYKQFGADFSAALTACGFTKTTDTGQVNWVTVAAVPASFTGVDYEIRQFTDSLQASAPFYARIEFAAISYGGNSFPVWRFRFGTGVDGAGNLTGNLSDQFQMISTTGNVAAQATLSSYFSGDGSRVSIIWNPAGGVTNTNFVIGGFAVERLKDSTGADTASGIVIILNCRQPNKIAQVVFRPNVGTVYPATASAWTCAAPASGTAAFAGNIGLFPVLPNIGYPNYPCISCLGFFQTDAPGSAATFSVSMYGVSRTYMTESTLVSAGTGITSTSINGNTAVFVGAWLYQ